jgi:hypothetical protein
MLFEERRLSSPRSLANRRSYAVLEYLSVAAQAPIMSPDDEDRYPPPADDAQAAMICADAAETARGQQRMGCKERGHAHE